MYLSHFLLRTTGLVAAASAFAPAGPAHGLRRAGAARAGVSTRGPSVLSLKVLFLLAAAFVCWCIGLFLPWPPMSVSSPLHLLHRYLFVRDRSFNSLCRATHNKHTNTLVHTHNHTHTNTHYTPGRLGSCSGQGLPDRSFHSLCRLCKARAGGMYRCVCACMLACVRECAFLLESSHIYTHTSYLRMQSNIHIPHT